MRPGGTLSKAESVLIFLSKTAVQIDRVCIVLRPGTNVSSAQGFAVALPSPFLYKYRHRESDGWDTVKRKT